MGSVTNSPRDSAPSFRDPNFAATLSLLPGLGQIYTGQRRKGALFLAVGIINLFILAVLLFQQPILFSLHACAFTYHFKANRALEEALAMLQVGSAPGNILLSFMFAFIAVAMRDARNVAIHGKYQALYPTSALGLEEAASGSYVLHIALLVSAFILAFFFVSAPPPSKQFTVIEMVETVSTAKTHKEARLKSSHSTDAHGPKSHEAPAQQSHKSASSQTSKSKSLAHAEQKVEKERQEVKPTAAPPAISHPEPPLKQLLSKPLPQPSLPKPVSTPALPVPHAASSAATVALPLRPMPSAKSSTTAPMPLPQLNLAQLPAAAGPAPTRVESTHMATPNPAVAMNGRRNTHDDFPQGGPQASNVNGEPAGSSSSAPAPSGEYQKTGQGHSHGTPSPTKANFSGGPANSQPLAFGPAVLGNETGRESRKGGSDTAAPAGLSGPEVVIDTDWGLYMNELQRRIKTHWFPAKNLESVKVVVVFKVSKNGELSNLRLQRSSGYAEADKRALAAVENAAPFRMLPPHADPMVDIQFTFDYNVFKGGSRTY